MEEPQPSGPDRARSVSSIPETLWQGARLGYWLQGPVDIPPGSWAPEDLFLLFFEVPRGRRGTLSPALKKGLGNLRSPEITGQPWELHAATDETERMARSGTKQTNTVLQCSPCSLTRAGSPCSHLLLRANGYRRRGPIATPDAVARRWGLGGSVALGLLV